MYAQYGGVSDHLSIGQTSGMAYNNVSSTSAMTTPGGMASGMASASPMSSMGLMTSVPHLPPTPQPSMSPISPLSPAMFGSMAAAPMGQGYQGWAGNMNLALAYGSHVTNQNTPGMPLGPQSQGMPHQYHIGQAPMSALAPTPGSGPMPAASRPLNSRPPTVERRPGLANSSSGSGADSAASGPERDSAHRVTKRQGRKKQTRANKDGEGDLSISDSSNLQWRPGMRQIKILDSWSEERKEATRIRNELISRCKADHIRDQNRVSARKSRQKKEDALQTARSNVQKLQEQNAALAQQVQELATRVNIQQDEIDSRGQTIAMFASENAALQERINLLEMQILEGGQGTQGFPAEQIPGQNLAQVLPPYSGQVQSQLQGSMFMQDSAQNFTQRRSNTPIQAQGEAASEQAQATPSSQRGLEIQEAPRGGELDQGQEGEGADTNPATSDLSPVNTSQCQARPGGQVNGEIADAGDMPIFDFQVLDDFLDDAGQA